MPSLKQIIAEIQLAHDLGPNQKQFAVRAVRDAEERLKLKAPSTPRKVTNAKGLMTLEQWECGHSRLDVSHLHKWIEVNGLDLLKIAQLISEFRTEMISKGKQYANFRAAFQTYLIKGYLSQPLTACKKQNTTVIHARGGAM